MSDKHPKLIKLNGVAKQRIQFVLFLALLILPGLLYFSAQTAQGTLNLVFLGLMVVVMVLVSLFV